MAAVGFQKLLTYQLTGTVPIDETFVRTWKPLKKHFRQKFMVPLDRFDATLQAWLYQYNMKRSGMRQDRIIDALIDCFH